MYIEREVAKSKATYMHGFGRNKYVSVANIDKIPAADVAPVVHGRWVDEYGGKYANAKYVCSVCGKKAHHDGWEWLLSDFCPNCGASMSGGKHGQGKS